MYIADNRCVKNFSERKNCVASFGTAKRNIKIVRINLKSTFSLYNTVDVGKDIPKISKINPWQANMLSFFQLSPHPLSSNTTSFLLDIVMDYSSLVRCVKKRAAKNYLTCQGKHFEHREKWQVRNLLKLV